MENEKKTPYAIICFEHGQQFLTETNYVAQLSEPDLKWKCPICNKVSLWDDLNYEEHLGAL